MIELVLVIVVLGILASLAMPRLDRDLEQEAADNILSAIRYTQHLALIDNKQKFDNPKWQRRFWRIYFGTCTDIGKFYAIGSDDDMTGSTNARITRAEATIDPSNSKPIWATDAGACLNNDVSENVFIEKKYDVTTIAPTGGCSNSYIAFDHLGRPYASNFTNSFSPNNAGYMTEDCKFTFSSSNNTFSPFSIIIKKETGYAYIEDQDDS